LRLKAAFAAAGLLAAAVPAAGGDALAAVALAQAADVGRRYETRCAGCHASADALARTRLEFRGDVLYGTKTGRPVAKFLAGHVALSLPEARDFTRFLERVERETAGPGSTR
jgi:hypothetical protein